VRPQFLTPPSSFCEVMPNPVMATVWPAWTIAVSQPYTTGVIGSR
jgi:hypothetical protein